MTTRIVGETAEYFESYLSKLSKDAADNYLMHFENFLDWLDISSQQLYERHRDNLQSPEPIKRMWLGKKINDYQEHMRDKLGYAAEDSRGELVATGGVLVPAKAISGFFRAVGIDSIPRNGNIPVHSEQIPSISKPQVAALLESTGNFKVKSVILFARDSGLRIGDITNLKYGLLREAIEDESTEYTTFTVVQEKTGRKADPCLGPESLQALRRWITYRTEKIGTPHDDDRVFCAMRTKSGYTSKAGIEVSGTNAGDPLHESTLGVLFRTLVRKAKLKPLPGERKKPSIHSLRKYFQTNMEAAGTPENWINRMTGRAGQGTSKIYSKPNETQLLEIYKSAYSQLRTQQQTATKKELTQTQSELDQVKAELASLKKQYDEWEFDPTVDPDTYRLAHLLEDTLTKTGNLDQLEELLDKLKNK